MAIFNNISIGILNGGKSTRMGFDKSEIIYKNKTIIELIFSESKKITDNIFILGRKTNNNFIDMNSRTLLDTNYSGPLGGFYSLSNCYVGEGFLLWACDMPLLQASDVLYMLEFSENLSKSVIPYNSEEKLYETLFAYYSKNTIEKILYELKIDSSYKSIQYLLNKINERGNEIVYKKLSKELISWNTKENIIK